MAGIEDSSFLDVDFAVLSTSALASNGMKLCETMQKEPSFDGERIALLYDALQHERERLQIWNVGLGSKQQAGSKPEENVAETKNDPNTRDLGLIRGVLGTLNGHFNRAKEQYAAFGTESAAYAGPLQSEKICIEACGALNSMVDTLLSLNDWLAIRESSSHVVPRTASEVQKRLGSARGQQVPEAKEDQALPMVYGLFSGSKERLPTIPDIETREQSLPREMGSQSSEQKSSDVTVEHVFVKCIEGFDHIMYWHGTIDAYRAHSKLQVWGAELFSGPLRLDDLFGNDPKAFETLRSCILKALVYILVDQGQSHSKLRNDNSNTFHLEIFLMRKYDIDMQDSQGAFTNSITSFLESEELYEYSLERRCEILERQLLRKAIAEEENSTRTSAAPSGESHVEYDNLIVDALSMIEPLFSALPQIRLARLSQCLVKEQEDQAADQEKEETAAAVSMKQLLRTAGTTIKKGAARSSKRGPSQTSSFRQEVENLEAFYTSRGVDISSGLKKNEPEMLKDKEAKLIEQIGELENSLIGLSVLTAL